MQCDVGCYNLSVAVLIAWSACWLGLSACADTRPGSANVRFLQITDVHLRLNSGAKEEGESTVSLLESALTAAAAQQPEFVIWTGDTAPTEAGITKQDVLASLQAATNAFKERLPGIPVFPVLGDGDCVPASTDPGPPRNAWLTHAAAEMWKDWLLQEAQAVFKFNGYYAVPLPRQLRLIALNTGLCDVKNWYAFVDQLSSQEMLAWLDMTLRRAQRFGERCLIIGHMPPGLWGGCWGDYSTRYEQLVAKHRSVIVGQFFGHQHAGSFRLLWSERDDQPPIAVAHVAPALGGGQGQAPSFRIYTIDTQSWRVSSFRQFSLPHSSDAGAAGSTGTAPALDWAVMFEPQQQFGIKDLSPTSFQGLLEDLRSNASYLAAYRAAECNGCQSSGQDDDDHSYLCGVAHVADKPHRDCMQLSEDELLKLYMGTKDTYVLSSLYPFKVLMAYFCHVMPHLQQSDCPDAGIPQQLPV